MSVPIYRVVRVKPPVNWREQTDPRTDILSVGYHDADVVKIDSTDTSGATKPCWYLKPRVGGILVSLDSLCGTRVYPDGGVWPSAWAENIFDEKAAQKLANVYCHKDKGVAHSGLGLKYGECARRFLLYRADLAELSASLGVNSWKIVPDTAPNSTVFNDPKRHRLIPDAELGLTPSNQYELDGSTVLDAQSHGKIVCGSPTAIQASSALWEFVDAVLVKIEAGPFVSQLHSEGLSTKSLLFVVAQALEAMETDGSYNDVLIVQGIVAQLKQRRGLEEAVASVMSTDGAFIHSCFEMLFATASAKNMDDISVAWTALKK